MPSQPSNVKRLEQLAPVRTDIIPVVPARASATAAPLLGEPLPIELMNTRWADRHGVFDALAGDENVAAWLDAVQQGGPTRPATLAMAHESGRQLRDLRDALRRLAAVATKDTRSRGVSDVPDRATALEIVNRAAASAPTWSELSWDKGRPPRQLTRSAHAPGQVAVAAIAQAGVALLAGPDRHDLRACSAPGCVLYFLRDHPRREWCSTACGNRARAARHYLRHRDDAQDSPIT
jgi:predicted RNA-binding Zn ribbon-like protein